MDIDYLAQPDRQLGRVLSEMLDSEPAALQIVFVSAFVSLQTIMRLKHQVHELKAKGVRVRFVVGIDLGGTSREVLEELAGWGIDVRIIKHRVPGHTFHPKLYLFEWVNRATIVIGSNNLTEGGFFGNYEAATRVVYQLPDDAEAYDAARGTLRRFLEPDGPVSYELTAGFLGELILRREIPTEAEARIGRDVARRPLGNMTKGKGGPLFGTENIEPPPPLSAELLKRLVKDVQARRKAPRKTGEKRTKPAMPVDAKVHEALLPAAFYMTLSKLQGSRGSRIPGEARVPLVALELAKEFWGWPHEYTKQVRSGAGNERTYWNWRPTWRVWSVETPGDVTTQEVRMYMYENSSDFRFYSAPLVNAGGNVGDVVRIRRVAEADAEFECVLARKGTPSYAEWITLCTQSVFNSERRFGYA